MNSIIKTKKNYSDKIIGCISMRGQTAQVIGSPNYYTITLSQNETPTSTELYDYSTSNAIKVKKAGYYKINMRYHYAATGAINNVAMEFKKNNTDFIGLHTMHQVYSTNSKFSGTAECCTYLIPTDYIIIVIYFSGGGTFGANGDTGYKYPKLTLTYMGEKA